MIPVPVCVAETKGLLYPDTTESIEEAYDSVHWEALARGPICTVVAFIPLLCYNTHDYYGNAIETKKTWRRSKSPQRPQTTEYRAVGVEGSDVDRHREAY